MNASVSFGRRVSFLALCAAFALPFAARGQWPTNVAWVQGGHGARVNAVTVSADGSTIITASDDDTVKLWNTNGALLRTFNTRPYQATAVAISPDNTKLAIGTYAGGYLSGNNGLGQVYLWQTSGGSLVTNAAFAWSNSVRFGKVTGLAFSTDNRLLAVADGAGSNSVFAAAAGTAVITLKGFTSTFGTAMITGCAFSSGGLFASGAEDDTVSVWSTNAWAPAFSTSSTQASNITAVAFSPNGISLATASLDNTIRVWNTASWSSVTLTGHSNGVTAVAFAPAGTTIASGASDGTLKLWSFPSGTVLATVAAHATNINGLAFLPDGGRVVSVSDDNTVKIWSVPGGNLVAQLGANIASIRAVAISPDGSLGGSVDDSQTIQLRNLATGQLVRSFTGQAGAVSAIAFSPDSAKLATGGGPLDPTIKIWSVTDGSLLQTIAATTNGVMALAYSPDGSIIASGGDSVEQTIRLWNTSNGSLRRNISGHTNGVTALAFSPSGGLLASGGRRFDNAIRVWSVTNGSLYRSFTTGNTNNIESLAFSPDNNSLAIGSSGANNLLVGTVSSGATLLYPGGTTPVYLVAFTPDGSTIAAANKDTLQFWQVGGTNLLGSVALETFQADALAYSPNANLLLFARGDATLALANNSLGALAPLPLVFNSISAGPAGSASLTAGVQPLAHYVVQTSPDLVNWSYQSLATSSSNTATISDTNAAARKFYRALTPP